MTIGVCWAAVLGPASMGAAATIPAPHVIGLVRVGANPTAVAVDDSDDNVYVANNLSNSVSVIDESGDHDNGAVTATVPVLRPNALGIDLSDHDLYVYSELANNKGIFSVIDESADANNGKVISSMPLGEQLSSPGEIAVDQFTHKVFVLDPGHQVWVIDESGDANNGKVISTIVEQAAAEFAVDPSSHNLYVLNGYTGEIVVVDESGDADNGKVTATITVPGRALNLAVDLTTHDVYTTNDSDKMTVVDESGDADNGKVTSTVKIGGNLEALAVDSVTHEVYVSDLYTGTVSVIDESGDADNGGVIARLALPGGFGYSHLAVDLTNHQIYDTYAEPSEPYGVLSVIGSKTGGVAPMLVGLPDAAGYGENYSYRFPLSGSPTPTVRLNSGGLPPGINLSPDGELTGTPTSSGTFTFAVKALNGVSPSAAESVVMFVYGYPTDLALTLSGPTTVTDGSSFTEVVKVTNKGPNQAPGTAVNLLVPPGLTVTAAPGATGSNPLVWTGATVAAPSSVTYRVTFSVASNVHATVTIGGVVFAGFDDTNPANNAATETVRLG